MRPYLSVIYQDDDIVVLDKPSGLLSVPGKAPEHRDSLMVRAQRVFPTSVIIHRLDMATSGIMVMPLNRPAMSNLARQFQERHTQKVYTAWVSGLTKSDGGVIHQPLRCDWPNRPKQIIDHVQGKSAQTIWRVLKRKGSATLVELHPITGRSHQLRVHMQYLGHPILGDRLYASEKDQNAAPRLQLHATRLQFVHPSTSEKMVFDSPASKALEFGI